MMGMAASITFTHRFPLRCFLLFFPNRSPCEWMSLPAWVQNNKSIPLTLPWTWACFPPPGRILTRHPLSNYTVACCGISKREGFRSATPFIMLLCCQIISSMFQSQIKCINWYSGGLKNECSFQSVNELPENNKVPKQKYIESILTVTVNKISYPPGVSQHNR